MKWIYQIGMGLNYLLDKGLIHRDISARNNLLDSSLNARLGDMGLAKNTGHEYNNDIYYPVSTQTPLPAYIMAPELLDSLIRHGPPNSRLFMAEILSLSDHKDFFCTFKLLLTKFGSVGSP